MTISSTRFGSFWNKEVKLHVLESESGLKAAISDYGGIINSLYVPDRHKRSRDVILGFDALCDYLYGHPFFGAIAGRCANRIPSGKFSIDGTSHQLTVNAPHDNHLHGGLRGFDKHVWASRTWSENGTDFLELSLVSPHLDEGYPGRLQVTALYTLSGNELGLEFTANTDRPTIVNLVNHAYFNLGGHDSGDIRGHELQIFADAVTPANEALIPTGEIRPVEGTAFDLREPKTVGEVMSGVGGVVDINYVLQGEKGVLRPAARLNEPESGRVMTVMTTAPGLQFYNGHKLGEQNKTGKGGFTYGSCAGLCLETQDFPNAVNTPGFPSTILRPGEEYRHKTIYKFHAE